MVDRALHVEELVVGYAGAPPVLKGISFDVAPGEFIALLGASGCGKTTLLRAISGFVRISSGRIRVGAADIAALPPDRRGMAMVFQSYALWPHMTAAQNIGYGLRVRGVGRDEIARRVAEIMAMLELAGLGERKVTQLSGGQQQRVALGRALAVNPQFLLLDEPLSNLDAQVRLQVRHEIKSLQRSLGITSIHVTHDREEAMVMADRLVILNQGAVAQIGGPEEVYNHPGSPYVAAFMGATNAIRLQARQTDGVVWIAAGAYNSEARVPRDLEGDRAAARPSGPVKVHFRSESARLGSAGGPSEGELVLSGRITQSSYPGGFYRYAVAIGEHTFMVDDKHRLEVGQPVSVRLPFEALHLYPEAAG